MGRQIMVVVDELVLMLVRRQVQAADAIAGKFSASSCSGYAVGVESAGGESNGSRAYYGAKPRLTMMMSRHRHPLLYTRESSVGQRETRQRGATMTMTSTTTGALKMLNRLAVTPSRVHPSLLLSDRIRVVLFVCFRRSGLSSR